MAKPIPEGYYALTPSLAVDNAEKAIEFYKRAFGAKERMRMLAPGGTIGHAELEIGDSVLMLADPLPQSIFTPAIKATSGHDENISFEEMCKRAGPVLSRQLRDISLNLYQKAADYARQRGILIADTKFEFGRTALGITLADEVLTPDSSRFWPAEKYDPGRAQESFDKQYVRDYLEEIRWNKLPPAPALPVDVARNTSEKYLEAYRQLTGRELEV